MKLTFHRACGYLHIYLARRDDEHCLDYDLDDFQNEFKTLAAGEGRYRIDSRLERFLAHYFGTSF